MYFSSFLQQSKCFINWFFLLSDNADTQAIPQWRISAFRIILFCSFLQCLFSMYSTYSRAIEFNLLYIVITTIAFLSFITAVFILSCRFYKLSAHLFLINIVASSIAIDALTMTTELAHAGYVLMYASPIIALMLLGYRVALFYMALNILPLYLLSNDVDLLYSSHLTMQLPNAMLRVNSLVFVFFNISIPLALIRIIVAAKRINQIHLSSNECLKGKSELYRDFFTDSDNAQIIVDNNGYVVDYNHSTEILFDIDKVDSSLLNSKQLLTSFLPSLALNDFEQCQIIEYKDLFLQVTNQKTGSSKYNVYTFNNYTNEQAIKNNLLIMEQENKRLKYSDNIMGLPNKYWFENQSNRFILKNKAVIYIVIIENIDNEYLKLKYGQEALQKSLVNAYKKLKNSFNDTLLPAYVENERLAFMISGLSKLQLEEKLLTEIKPMLDSESPLQQSFRFGYAYHQGDQEA